MESHNVAIYISNLFITMPITDWPEAEKPREKLLKQGAQALSDAELLAIFLRTGVAGKTAVDLARELLQQRSLQTLLGLSLEEFSQYKGLGLAKYVQLQATLEMAKRYLEQSLYQQDVLTSSTATQNFCKVRLQGLTYEVFACLFLDSQNRLIMFDELFRGTIDKSSIYPREVIKQALLHNAASVIFTHNHPSGVVKPSQADIKITQHLKNALQLVDIQVLDHIIVGIGASFSFAEHGIL